MIIIIHVRSMGFGRDLLYDRLEAMYIANYLIFFWTTRTSSSRFLVNKKKSNHDAEVGIIFPSFDLYSLFDTTLHCAFKRPYPIHTYGWTDYMLGVFSLVMISCLLFSSIQQ